MFWLLLDLFWFCANPINCFSIFCPQLLSTKEPVITKHVATARNVACGIIPRGEQPPCRVGQWRWTRGHCPICMHNDTPVTSQGSSHSALAACLTAVLGSLPKPGEVGSDVTTHFHFLLIFSPSLPMHRHPLKVDVAFQLCGSELTQTTVLYRSRSGDRHYNDKLPGTKCIDSKFLPLLNYRVWSLGGLKPNRKTVISDEITLKIKRISAQSDVVPCEW
jgi:hypothetical protein